MLFTHSASFSSPAPPTSTATASTSPPSSRSSRLRRFSHLRSYHPSHLLSRDSTTTTNTTGSGGEGLTRSTSDFSNVASQPAQPAQPASSSTSEPSSSRNRLMLVNSAPAPSSRTNQTASAAATAAATNDTSTASTSAKPPSTPAVSTAPVPSPPLAESPLAEDFRPQNQPVQSQSSLLTEQRQQEQQKQQEEQQESAAMTRARASTMGDAVSTAAATAATTAADFMPSIRFSAYYDPRATRPSLTFPTVSRTLPTGAESIRVGRYSERDSQSMANLPHNQPSSAPVGFKSKVVSRRHCEFWNEDGKWYVKDVKSSSGTFLNHIRLSPPSQESKAFPVNDGDIVQLGIDFKGGEEMIFRCVKMRIELNRGWQNKLNTFNKAAHQRLRKMAFGTPSGSAGGSPSQDCSICLNSIAPCQSLFVAPCSHTWHFKCVRALLTSPQYPIFICPNCRAGADLEADVDDPAEEWEELEAEGENGDKSSVNGAPLAPASSIALPEPEASTMQDTDAMDVTVNLSASDIPVGLGNIPHSTSEPLPIPNPASGSGRASTRDQHTPSPPRNGHEGPITPRNEAGPWVFDGSAGQRRREDEPESGMRSLDAAADQNPNGDASNSAAQ